MSLVTFVENMSTPIAKVCLESLKRHNPDAIVFDRKSVKEIHGGEQLLEKFGHLSILHFSDIFRVWFLLHFGGTWIDADCLHLRRMESPATTNKLHLLYQDYHRKEITQFYLHVNEPGNAFLSKLLERQTALVADKGPHGLKYLDLGEWSINHIRSEIGSDQIQFLPHWEHHYIAWYNSDWFHRRKHWGEFQFDRGLYNPNAFCYHLTNRVLSEFGYMTEQQLKQDNSFLGFLVKRAIDNGFKGSKDSAILRRLPDVHASYKYCEIGVYKGFNTAIIGQQRYNAKVVGVDPWRNVSSCDYRSTGDYIAVMTDAEHEAAYKEAIDHNWFLISQKRIDFVRTTSVDGATRFEDEQFDMVFIDGDHSEVAVAQDIHAWWPKIKSGGWIGGHDYNHPEFQSGVGPAVNKFCGDKKLTFELDEDYTWFVKKQ